MDLELSKCEKELADRGRRFFEEVLAPLEPVCEEHGELPMERRAAVSQAVRDWGLAGINHSREHGGQGFTFMEQTVIEEQLGRASNGLWTCVWRPAVCLKNGTKEQIEEFLVPSCAGERRPSVAMTSIR